MKEIRKILIFCFFLTSGLVMGQEAAVFTHYNIQPVLINAGATGFGDYHQFFGNYRSKWSAFDGAPRTFTFMYHGAINDRIGLGAQFYNDRVGANNVLHFQLNYAYKFKADLFDFGIGLSTGIQQFSLRDINDDPFVQPGDMLIAQAMDGVTSFDASVGIFGSYDESFRFGLSFPNLIRTRLSDIAGDVEVDVNEFGYMLFLGYLHEVTDYDFLIEPSILVKKIRYVPFQLDVNLLFKFLQEQLIGGLTYSFGTGDRLGFLIGTRIDKLRLYYSYDVNFGDLQQYNNGSHEFSINYIIPSKKVSSDAPGVQ